MADTTKKMTVQLPATLHDRLARAAERDHRSLHKQMLAYIERCLDQDEREARDGS
jgi:hypothetical protein